ncbi:hypothetical protein HK097_005900 [Rhizophlyctis rosea]|uniref:Eukaryotic translation initiation factor 2A n=1 Tax=Rhizophlyctis rosea TaxID=64517 RepID=A0AAD5X2B3_9FUNG|nr:hypothetical protein HK097_005900 [Rhizophlyctis rosea]
MADKVVPQFAYRSNAGITIKSGPPEYKTAEESAEQLRAFQYSPDGSYLAWILQDSIRILEASTNKQVQELPVKNVIEIEFSPRGTFLSTWERLVKTPDSETNPHKNLTIWKTATGEKLTGFTQKNQSGWNVDWTEDESSCARLVSNEVQFYDSKNFAKGISSRLKSDGVTDFSLSPGRRPTVCVFIPEKKGQPAAVRLFDITNLGVPLAHKSFYRADSVQFHWNKLGTNVLVFTHTDVDKTGQSYYGETALYYLSITGNYDCRVELDKPGPIHDLAWSPNSKEFIVVYGTMPSKATLFDHRANPVYEFGNAARNTVRFSPQGRLLYIAGFGNLAGDLDVWDRKTFKKLVTIPASNSSLCEWCPDSRHIMTAILYKRLKVDNGVRIWHYTGSLVHQVDAKEMYEVAWRPAKADLWPELRSLSPPPQHVATVQAPAKPAGVYRPPGARGSAPAFSLRDPAPEAASSSSSNRIPGQVAPDAAISKAALKNKKKREAKKGQGSDDSIPQSSSPAPASPVPSANGASPVGPDVDKKIKNLTKKLKQIADIKAKIAAGEKLELTQMKKVEGEAELRKELEALQIS